MAINLCNEKLGTTISSPQVSADDYDLGNLLSTDLAKREHGYRAEYFIKPPISISIQFPTLCDIYYIKAGLHSGEHRTCCLDLSTRANDHFEYKFVSKYFTKKPIIMIVNPAYTSNRSMHRSGFSIESMPMTPQNDIETFHVAQRSRTFFFRVNSVQFRLLRCINSSIFCLNNLEIMGQPVDDSKNRHLATKLISLAASESACHKPKSAGFYGCVDTSASSTEITSRNSDEDLSDKIPEEFIDPITNDIMIFPMLLPCGTSIDRSTLEKHIQNETSWNREPSDPFTKIVFTKDTEPTINTVLKAKIDAYINTRCKK